MESCGILWNRMQVSLEKLDLIFQNYDHTDFQPNLKSEMRLLSVFLGEEGGLETPGDF